MAGLSNEDERAKSLAEATEGAFDVDLFRFALISSCISWVLVILIGFTILLSCGVLFSSDETVLTISTNVDVFFFDVLKKFPNPIPEDCFFLFPRDGLVCFSGLESLDGGLEEVVFSPLASSSWTPFVISFDFSDYFWLLKKKKKKIINSKFCCGLC